MSNMGTDSLPSHFRYPKEEQKVKNALFVTNYFNSILNHKSENLNIVKYYKNLIFACTRTSHYIKILRFVNNKINYYLVDCQ